MKKTETTAAEAYARQTDESDPLARYRSQFHVPKTSQGEDCVYLTGNSLGLQPKKTAAYVQQELDDWAKLGVEGHLHAKFPWLPYHENLTEQTARLVGALPSEVVVMNTLTVNLHLMMVSFYRPTKERFRILIEGGAFPSDRYAVASQARFHGFDPAQAITELKPRAGEETLRPEDVLETIERSGDQIALILLGNVNYLTGQAFDVEAITRAGHSKGCKVGFDLAHGVGSLCLKLHEWGPDFAAWCSYKYLNGGPGALGGCFVHERHASRSDLPRFSGWWGHNKKTRFAMGPTFDPILGAEGWQLSNPPIFQMAALRASMEIFDEATMPAIRKKGDLLLEFLERELDRSRRCRIITPRRSAERGLHLSLKFQGRDTQGLVSEFSKAGVTVDFREPDVIRAAFAPLYCNFMDVVRFVKVLESHV